MSRHIPAEDLALYAMQLLETPERIAIERHISQCPDCSGELAAIQGDLAVIALSAEMHSPPALARQRTMNQVAREKRPAQPLRKLDPQSMRKLDTQPLRGFDSEPASPGSTGRRLLQEDEEQETPRRGGFGVFMPYVGWAVAAAIGFITFNFYNQREELQGRLTSAAIRMSQVEQEAQHAKDIADLMSNPSAIRVMLTKGAAPPAPTGKVTYMPEKGSLIFTASNMDPLLPYKIYELWVIPANGQAPIPAGTFRPDDHGNAAIIMPELPRDVQAKAFGVTVEDNGGSQSPTMPIIISGT
jgi:anti-sigma-K factor RskA